MGSRDRRTGIFGRLAVTAGVLVGAAALVGVGGSVSAQQPDPSLDPPSASAVADCVDDTGRIVVTILDNATYRYNISIGGVVVAADVADGDDGINIFEPYADGAYPVVVTWISAPGDGARVVFDPPVVVLSTTVTVDCVVDVTSTAPETTASATTVPPTTVPPTTVPPTTAPAAAAPATTAPAATLPATGRASRTVAMLAGLLTLAGGSLLLARRQPGRA
jgi:LPXTG-motif cell wall-anchored protein